MDKWDISSRGMVRGYTWKVRFSNGMVLEAWTGQSITRTEARAELLDRANFGHDWKDDPDGMAGYAPSDIDNLWKTKR